MPVEREFGLDAPRRRPGGAEAVYLTPNPGNNTTPPPKPSTYSAPPNTDREHYGWISTTVNGRPVRYGVLAAAAHPEAVLAVHMQDTDTVALAPARPAELTDVFLAQLPKSPPASGKPVSARYPGLRSGDRTNRARRRQTGPGGADDQRGTRPAQDRRRQPVHGRPRSQARHPETLPSPLNYLDTTTGRWLTRLDTSTDCIATLHPAGVDLLATELTARRLHAGGPHRPELALPGASFR